MIKFLLKNIGELIIGRKLSKTTKKLLNEAPNNIQKETVGNLLAQIFYRLTRIGIIALLLASIPIVLLYNQNKLIGTQNKLIANQNQRIEQQTYLLEGSLRNGLIFESGNILNQFFEQLDANNTINDNLIARMSGFCLGLTPYKLFINDTITIKPYSPEKTHLFSSILFSNIDSISWGKIKRDVSFSHLYLAGTNMTNIDLSGARIGGANFSNIALDNMNFNGAYLNSSDFYDTDIRYSKFNKVWAPNTNFENANFLLTNMKGTMFGGNNFKNATFMQCKLDSIVFDGADLRGCSFSGSELNGCIMIDAKIYKHQIRELIRVGITEKQIDEMEIVERE